MYRIKPFIFNIFLFFVFAGTLFFIPNWFVNRFKTAPLVWMQMIVVIGVLGFIFIKKSILYCQVASFYLLSLYVLYTFFGEVNGI